MDESDLLSKLEELALEENQIVTVKGFSQFCEIHVNKAKYVMSKFKDNHKDDVVACFMVVGYKMANNKRSISVVLSKEDEIENVKSGLTNILSNSIYSISKTYPKCESDLYAAEISLCEKSKGSTVPPALSDPKITIREKSTTSNIKTSEGNFSKTFKPAEKMKPQQTFAIAAAFSKTVTKNESPQPKDQEKKTEPESKKAQLKDNNKSNNKTKGAMMAFVQKGVVNTKLTPKAKEIKLENKVEPTDVKKLEKDIWSDSSEEEDKEDPIPRKKKTEPQKKPAKKMKRIIMASSSESEDEVEEKVEKLKEKSRKTLTETKNEVNKEKEETSKGSVKENKKRKTIVVKESKSQKRKISLSSDEDPRSNKKAVLSEEEDIENNIEDDDDDVIPPTPINQRLKTVKTTYQDEDGFFVTRKEKCLIEVQPEEKSKEPMTLPIKGVSTNNGNGEKKKNVVATKQKQSSISSYFKKS